MRGKFESQLYLNIFTDAVHTAYRLQSFRLQLLVNKAALPEQQQVEQESQHEQRLFFTQQDTAPVAGKF